MKLKKLSGLEKVLLLAVIALLAVNLVLQLNWLRYVMWTFVVALVAVNLFLVDCPHCEKKTRPSNGICHHCGKPLSEEVFEKNEETEE